MQETIRSSDFKRHVLAIVDLLGSFMSHPDEMGLH
jgi:hypothetical protein